MVLTPNKKAQTKRKSGMRISTTTLHMLMIPTVVLLLVYSYLPMLGLIMAFQKFNIAKGVSAFFVSPFVGLAHFNRVFNLPGSIDALRNTVVISFYKIVTMFFIPIFVALLLNEMNKQSVKRSIQTLIYLPHFLSWVILGGVIKNLLASDGMVNTLLYELFGSSPKFFLGDAQLFQPLLIFSHVWKEFGWSTIVYLAAITNINPELYEAAVMDGANRFQQTLNVTLPGMQSIIVLTAVLSLGGVLNAGFDQVFNLYSVPVYTTGDILDTFVYRISMQSGQYEIGTAVGLLKSIVSAAFIVFSYWAAKRFANYEVF